MLYKGTGIELLKVCKTTHAVTITNVGFKLFSWTLNYALYYE
jgi:hypothetical protein